MNYEEVKKSRLQLIKSAKSKQLVKTNDKRLTNGGRICAICHKKLSETRIVEIPGKNDRNIKKQLTIAISKHYVLNMGGILKVSICYDSRQCLRQLKKVGELE